MLKKINMFRLHITKHDVRFRASHGGDLKRFFNAHEACTMKKIVCLIASAVLILSTSGCATNRCGNGLFGGGLFNGRLLQGGLFDNGPLSDGPLRSFFRGAACSTCNPASGQLNNCGSNVAPLCRGGNCGGHSPVSAPANIQLDDPGVPYYDSPSMVVPQAGTPTQATGIIPQGTIIQNGNSSVLPQGSSNRVTYGVEDLPTIDAFSNSIDADALPPTP
jgi:hypothetical protein